MGVLTIYEFKCEISCKNNEINFLLLDGGGAEGNTVDLRLIHVMVGTLKPVVSVRCVGARCSCPVPKCRVGDYFFCSKWLKPFVNMFAFEKRARAPCPYND